MRPFLLTCLLVFTACGPVHQARGLCRDAPKAIRHVSRECHRLHVATEARRRAPAAHKAPFHDAVQRAAQAVLKADSLFWHDYAVTLRAPLTAQ